jgi:hypothetical protein
MVSEHSQTTLPGSAVLNSSQTEETICSVAFSCMLLQVSPSPSPAAALPEALTAQILLHVPQQQRLQQCALTCKAWAAAAALATVHVQQKFKPDVQAISAFNSWLQRYAEHIETLELSRSDRGTQPQLRLCKLAKLQRLQLEGVALLLQGERAGSGSAGQDTHTPAPPLLPSLQHLELSSVQLVSTSSLLQLAGAAGITSLRMQDVTVAQLPFNGASHIRNSQKFTQEQLAAAITSLLQQLPRLVVLELPGMPISAAAMQQLGSMQGLQEVSLEDVDLMPACALQHLPSSITKLLFRGNKFETQYFSTPSMPPELQQLTGLLRLELYYCAVAETVLGAFTCLQALKLQDCLLLPVVDDSSEDGSDHDENVHGQPGTAALLDALAGMTCLQDVELRLRVLDTVSTAPQRFAALTASTQLTRLAIMPRDCIPLAKGAVRYMFPAGRQFPLLQELTISPEVTDSDWAAADEWCVGSADIKGIAACCTALKQLNIAHIVRPGDRNGWLPSCTVCHACDGAHRVFSVK